MTTDPLESSWYSVDHAMKRIDEFEVEVNAFSQTDPFEFIVEYDPDTLDEIHKIKLTKSLPINLKGIAFDAIISLRSALDNAGYAVAIANNTKGKNAHFPFGGTDEDIQRCRKKRSKDIPSEIFDLMAACKPFKEENTLLWALNKLCNTRKHEIIIPMVISDGPIKMDITRLVGKGPISGGGCSWDFDKNEMEYMRIGHGASLDIDMNIHFSYVVAIGYVDVLRGQPANDVLRGMAVEVNNIIINIETEAKRIGIFK